ncbi:STU1 [Candida oxycetoniae]|uniref:Protein STU1 n=1 Tax=Candida oxycetoniae TaxID=497107 RepID=A0AAI9SZ54_9ASCO|nr:STU1 [Candida oxycetoniae]KAI3405856.2 STU1 [Candida oxycetoniae]
MMSVFTSDSFNNEDKLRHIQTLKTHIKKDMIDLTQVPLYLQVIMKGLEVPELGISNVSFNSLSYLIKRISVQDKSGNILKDQSFLILPVIINKFKGTSSTAAAKKALEDYWLSAPDDVENALMKISFTTTTTTTTTTANNLQIAIESIRWMNQVLKTVSLKFNVMSFIPHILQLVANNTSNDVLLQAVRELTSTVVSNSKDANLVKALQEEIETNKISSAVASRILPPQTSSSNLSSLSRQNTTNLAPNIQGQIERDNSLSSNKDDGVDGFSFEERLSVLLNKVNYELVKSVRAQEVQGSTDLYNIFDSFEPYFEGKETESNWKMREKKIIEARQILRGNAPHEYLSDLLNCLRSFVTGICKGASSLRTTLCTHGCQLIKECAIILSAEFEPVAELIFPTLMKLCLSTKNITSTNANMVTAALFANLPYNQRLVQKVMTAMEERNFQPRSYSAIWLQILLLRYGMDSTFFGHHVSTIIESTNKLLTKLLKDANPNVRQVSKDCYWCYSRIFPEESDKLLKKLDAMTIKALERSQKELGVLATTPKMLTTKPSRQSLKKQILEKNRELRYSRPSSRTGTTYEPTQRALPSNPLPKPQRSVSKVETKLEKNEFRNRPTPRASSWTPQSTYHSSSSTTTTTITANDNNNNNNNNNNNTSAREQLRSRTEISTRSPLHGDRVISLERNRTVLSEPIMDNSKLFVDQRDPIVDFLSSRNSGDIMEGVNLLKYAIIGNEDFTSSHVVKSRLKYISEKDVSLLKPLLTFNDLVFKKSSKLFTTDDFVRICALVFKGSDERILDLITSCIEVPIFFQASLQLLASTVDSPEIVGSHNLKLQISAYQMEIAKSVLEFLSILLTKIVVTDVQFGDLLSELFRSVLVFKSTEVYDILKQLFCQLYTIDSSRFISLLEDTEIDLREEIELIVGVDNAVAIDKPLNKSVFEFTQLNPREKETQFSKSINQKKPSSSLSSLSASASASASSSSSSSSSSAAAATLRNDPFVGAHPLKLAKSLAAEELPQSHGITTTVEQPDSLATDLAQVHITKNMSKSADLKSLKAIIEQVDPLNPLPNKRKINIYEDNKYQPTSRSEKTWDNYKFWRLTYGLGSLNLGLSNIDQFEKNCFDLSNLFGIENIEDSPVLKIIETLEPLATADFEFREYFLTKGKYKLTNGLLAYFQNIKKLNHDQIMSGLYLLRQIFKYDESIDMNQIWNIFYHTCYNIKLDSELYIAWNEIILNINHTETKSSFAKIALDYLEKEKNLSISISDMCLNFLAKILIEDSDLNEEKLYRLDNILGKLFTKSEVIYRRSATMCYSSLLRNDSLTSESKQILNKMKGRYSISQQRLIEFYSQR